MTGFRSALASTLISFLIALGGPVAAQETNEISLDATYLSAPTDWCPADAGVPVVIKMDGPDIIGSPKDWPRTLRVRRGNQLTVVGREENASYLRQHRVFDPEVIGRFSAEFRACQNPWSWPRVDGHWRLKASDGSELDADDLNGVSLGGSGLLFFRHVNTLSDVHYARLGDRTFFAASRPNVTTSQTFAAGTHKE